MTLLELDDVYAGYETGRVLSGVSISVEEGEVVSLLGRNGAGKTTTLRTIMGVRPPQLYRGDIRFRNESLVGLRTHEIARRDISIVPEERRLWPNLTVEESLQMVTNHVSDPKGVDEVLSYFPTLEEMVNKQARNMSGGEQQMLAIARGFTANPDLMLLDEPSEGLAPFIVRNVEEIIKNINQDEGVALLVVEQNTEMAMEVSDRHYILDQGQIITETTPNELRVDEELRQKYLGV